MKKVLFICTGNTCRSPMAMFLFNQKASKGFVADSAGLNVHKFDKIAQNSVWALKQFGIENATYNSKQLNKKMFDEANLVVVMTSGQKSFLPKDKKVVSYFDLTGQDVLDPYGQDEQAYLDCANQIMGGFDKILKLLK